jgi:hypothetical protein
LFDGHLDQFDTFKDPGIQKVPTVLSGGKKYHSHFCKFGYIITKQEFQTTTCGQSLNGAKARMHHAKDIRRNLYNIQGSQKVSRSPNSRFLKVARRFWLDGGAVTARGLVQPGGRQSGKLIVCRAIERHY